MMWAVDATWPPAPYLGDSFSLIRAPALQSLMTQGSSLSKISVAPCPRASGHSAAVKTQMSASPLPSV